MAGSGNESFKSFKTGEITKNGCDKVSRYGWVVQDEPGELLWVSKAELHVDHSYQRDLNELKVLRLVREWSWLACGAIHVADRGGRLWVFEGQHRLAAALRRSDIQKLPAIVFQSRSVETEAAAFLRTNTDRKAIDSIARFSAQLVSGDAVALGVKRLVDECGIRLTRSTRVAGDLKSVQLLMRLYVVDAHRLRRVLRVCALLGQRAAAPIPERLIDGLFLIDKWLSDDCGGLTDDRLFRRVLQVGQEGLLAGAAKASALYAKGGARVWAIGMMIAINKGLRRPFETPGDSQ